MAKNPPRILLDSNLDGSCVRLGPDSAHYFRDVLRLGVGRSVIVFDGRGTERFASIRSLSKRESILELGESRSPLPASPVGITLVQGLIKADGMDTVVQKTTELGVSRVLAVRMKFSTVKLDAERSPRKLEHWRRVARSACEQSQRHYPPIVDVCDSLEQAIHRLPADTFALALHNHAGSTVDEVDPQGRAIALIVGPEGGLSPAEIEWLVRRGCRMVRLGPRTLRAETAAIVGSATAQLLWGDFC